MQDIPPKQRLMQFLTGNWTMQAVYVAAKLKIADLLVEGPMSAKEIAQQARCDAHALYRLLRALASIGVFEEVEDERFALTPLADCLRTDSPDSLWAPAVLLSEMFYDPWGDLLHSVTTGENAFEKAKGMPVFDYFAAHPEHRDLFHATIATWMRDETGAIVAAYDWPDTAEVVDVGGGAGALLFAVMREYPGIKGVLLDSPAVVEGAKAALAADEVVSRCRLEGGDFFQEVPTGADIYLLRTVLHDWDDERAIRILETCRKACGPEGRVLVIEWVVPPGNAPSFAKWMDLLMLVMAPGRERTEREYRHLLAEAGFEVSRVVPTTTEVSIIEAKRV